MGKLTRVLEKSGYELNLEAFKEPETEVEFDLVKEEECGADANEGSKVQVVYRDRDKGPIISEEWDDRLRKVVNSYRTSTESFRLLRSKVFSRSK